MVDSTKSILKGQEFNKSVRKDILINNIIWKRKATNHYNLHVNSKSLQILQYNELGPF